MAIPQSAPINTKFAYKALRNQQDLRLLRLNYYARNTLECHLFSEPFDVAYRRGYYALSYCWGNEPFSSPIVVDGQLFFVKPNALRALIAVYKWHNRTSSSRQKDCNVWIDAICINQNDAAEKSVQVRRMDRVYTSALHTLIWLGPAEDESDKVMATISQASWVISRRLRTGLKNTLTRSFKNFINSQETEYYKRQAKDLQVKHDVHWSTVTSFADLVETIQLARSSSEAAYNTLFYRNDPMPFPRNNSFWQSLDRLFSRAWFSRVWTFQEGVLSKKATVLCGDAYLDWTVFREWRPILKDWSMRALLADQVYFVPDPATAGSYDRGQIGTGFEALQNILVFDTSTRYASVNKDFVYGVLGIVGSETAGKVSVDYNIPDWVVFAQTAKILVEGSIGANSWSCMLDRFPIPSDRTIDGLPSWCPDFTRQSVIWTERFHLGTELQGRMVREDIVEKLSVAGSVVVASDLRTVTVTGYVVDTIDQICEFALGAGPSTSTWEQIWEQKDAFMVTEWLSALERMCEAADLSFPEDILFFFFEGTDWPFNDDNVKSHQQPKRFDQVYHFLQQTAGVQDVQDLIQRFQDIRLEVDADSDASLMQELERYVSDIRRTRNFNRGRRFFTTTAGRLGFSAARISPGQQVCYFSGSYNFKVLSAQADQKYEYIGIASVEGIMDQELLKLCSDSTRKVFEIR